MGKTFCHIYAQLDQCRDRLSEDLNDLLDLGLVCDCSVGFEQGKKHRETLRRLIAAGGIVAPNLYPAMCDPVCTDPNWWTYSEAECLRLLKIGMEKFAGLDLGEPFAVNTYTPGNEFVRACRRLGIRYILGFTAPTVGEDGGWKIADYGAPLSPYFIGSEDFRKPEASGTRPDPVMMVSMELRNPLVCLHHWNEGPWCPLNAQAADRWLEPSDTPYPFMAVVDDWISQAERGGRDNFFTLNLQYFFAPACRDHNRVALRYLAKLVREGRLENGTVRDWEKRMRAAGGFARQDTCWRGELPGFHTGNRAGFYPEVAVSEDLTRQAVWKYPEARPARYYDYRKTWNCRPFQPDGSDPVSTDFASLTVSGTPGAGTWKVTVDNAGSPVSAPLWFPEAFRGLSAPFVVPDGAEVLPHPSGVGASLIVERVWPAGRTELEFPISGVAAPGGITTRKFGALLEAQEFTLNGRRCTVVAGQTPDRFTVRARVRRSCEHESLCGIDWMKPRAVAPGTEIELRFDCTRLAMFHRFWDLACADLELEGVDEAEAALRRRTAAIAAKFGVEVGAPGYQLFGNLREPDRWARKLGRAAGLAERKAADAYFAAQRPEAGAVVISAHPGILLPRGSITKVLGHEFDQIDCAPGYSFRELCADYPQGWDWGVTAWVQWRHLNVEIDGLCPGRSYQLHVHAIDAESRHYGQRFEFTNSETGETVRFDPHWRLPEGVENRFSPEALTTVDLSRVCPGWKRVRILIVPVDGAEKPYNWVVDKAAPGVFSHLWVTEISEKPGFEA